MNLLHDIPLTALHFYLTAPYSCSYLPEREAQPDDLHFIQAPAPGPPWGVPQDHGFGQDRAVWWPQADGADDSGGRRDGPDGDHGIGKPAPLQFALD